jgi:hypothetical protein
MARKISRPAGRNRPAPTQRAAGSGGQPAQRTAVAAPARARSREEMIVENFFLGVLLFFLAVMVFYPAFHAGFIWDDDQLLTANPLVKDPSGWWRVWVEGTADYFPLTTTTCFTALWRC